MASFFPLGGGGGGGGGDNDEDNQQQKTWLWYKTANEITWQQQQEQPQQEMFMQQLQQQQEQQRLDLYSTAAGFGVGPSQMDDVTNNPASTRSGMMMMMGRTNTISCQDCGNQAKKDCVHMRCRTCCKSRGFDCPTHVRSTWIPVARRRDRQQQLQLGGGGGENVVKRRQRENIPANSSSFVPTAGFEAPGESSFPPEVTTEALFRCVRLSSIEDGDDQYAYQTAVNIGGHVFKGILYDQGPEGSYNMSGGGGGGGSDHQSSSCGGDGGGGGGQLSTLGGGSSSAFIDPSNLYPVTQVGTFMLAGSEFFPNPRSS